MKKRRLDVRAWHSEKQPIEEAEIPKEVEREGWGRLGGRVHGEGTPRICDSTEAKRGDTLRRRTTWTLLNNAVQTP